MTEDWMSDDIVIISDDDEVTTDEAQQVVKKLDEMKNKILKSEEPKKGEFSLPISEVTAAWMDDDIATLDSEDDEPVEAINKNDNSCYSPSCCGEGACYSPLCKMSSSSKGQEEEYDDDDMETQMLLNRRVSSPKALKEGRLSALAEAQRFSCDEEDFEAEVIENIKLDDAEESTSWAFVAAKEASHTKDDGIEKKLEKKAESSEHSTALVVEIIEKEKKIDTVDKEGYKVITSKK